MKYYTYSIYITICKILYVITFTNIIATNNTESIINYNSVHYKEESLCKQVKNINQPLSNIFPIFSLSDGLCIKSIKKFNDGIDHLNLGKCEKIISFQLTFHDIIVVPEYVLTFKSVIYLCFAGNKLTSICFVIISQLINLKILDISNNVIEKIPESVSKLENLEELILFGNPFSYITSESYNNLKIKNLKLDGIKLVNKKNKYIKKDIIFAMINDCLKIKTLENLTVDHIDLSDFCFYNEEYYIKRLKLSRCSLSELPMSILKLKRLEYLNLKLNKFKNVPSILYGLKSLKELNLKRNIIMSYENIYFFSLEILHIECSENSNRNIFIKNISLPRKHPNIYIYADHYEKINFDKDTIKYWKGLYQYAHSYSLKMLEHSDNLKGLEFLHIDGDFDHDTIHLISMLKNLRELHLNLRTYKNRDFLSKLFFTLKNFTNLESLLLKECLRAALLDNKICELDHLKKIYIILFFIKDVTCFSKLKNLKFICFEDINFYESKEQVNFFLNKNKIEFTYKRCRFGYISSLDVEQ